MDKEKKLEAAGWKLGDAEDFLTPKCTSCGGKGRLLTGVHPLDPYEEECRTCNGKGYIKAKNN